MAKLETEGFKAFDVNEEGKMVCRDFVYEEGKTYTHDREMKPCSSGFHFCKNPFDVLNHYNIIDNNGNIRSSFAEVKAYGEVMEEGNKCCCSKIKIEEKFGFGGFIKAVIESMADTCKNGLKSSDKCGSQLVSDGFCSKLSSSGNDSKLVSGGNHSQLASSGDSSRLVSGGDCSGLASSGYHSMILSSGYKSHLASSGYNSQLTSSGSCSKLASNGTNSQLVSSGNCSLLVSGGHNSQLTSSGERSQLVSGGCYSQLTSSGVNSRLASSGDHDRLTSSGDGSRLASNGDNSQLVSSGDNCVIAGLGYKNIAKGKVGSWLVLAEYKKGIYPYIVKSVKAVQIDGKRIKEDTFYKLENDKFVEVKE